MPAISSHEPERLEVSELFRSIAGETTQAGRPALFVRLSGCNLACRWCDTPKARGPGRMLEVRPLARRLSAASEELVVLTGGEPLLQPACGLFCRLLSQAGKQVLVETNGSLDIGLVPPPARVIMDMKAPSSGETHRMLFDNLHKLKPGDELKLVVADREDYRWALELLSRRTIAGGVTVLFSPVWGRLEPARLAEWLLEEAPAGARLQLQMHKIIWPDGSDGLPLEMI